MPTDESDPYGLLDPELSQDPYPVYARLRAEAPMYFSSAWNAWLVTRYDDVLAGFRDGRLSSERFTAYAGSLPAHVMERVRPLVDNLTSWTLLMDPPRHTRLRALVNRAFTPRLVESLRPRIQAIVDDLCDRVSGKGRMDIANDLAVPLPVSVIGAMLGVRPEDGERLKAWSDAIAGFFGVARPTPEATMDAVRGVVEMEAYFRDVIEERRRSPREDILGALLNAREEGQILDERELLSTCTMVLFGGHETTTNLIGNGVFALLSRPEDRARLRDEPSLLPTAVEEMLRFDAPVQRMGRLAMQDVTLGGQEVKKGQLVFLIMGSANRDEAQFPSADTLDVGRRENRHLSFGMGTHYCVGAALGRMEAEIAIGTLLRRFPDLRPSGERPARFATATLRGFKSLPVLL